MITRILTARNLSRKKRRFDRGGLYLNYLAILVTGGTFLKVFGWTAWWHYLIGTIAVILLRYIAGYIDDKFGILSNEQDQLTRKNIEWNKMMNLLNEINNKLK